MLKAKADNPSWVIEHIRLYRETDGREGHLIDMRELGGIAETPTLLLKTIGRKSGHERIVPLVYTRFDDEYAIIASKGGAPSHPAWFLNLEAADEVVFQVGRDHFRGSWRIAEGAERDRFWKAMAQIYPLYDDYQAGTERVIPLVLLKAAAKQESL